MQDLEKWEDATRQKKFCFFDIQFSSADISGHEHAFLEVGKLQRYTAGILVSGLCDNGQGKTEWADFSLPWF